MMVMNVQQSSLYQFTTGLLEHLHQNLRSLAEASPYSVINLTHYLPCLKKIDAYHIFTTQNIKQSL